VIHDFTVLVAVLGIVAQVLVAAGLACLAAAAGAPAPLRAVRSALWGYELWAAFAVAALAIGGSLFFSEIAHFAPCELCWYERICLYPLAILTLLPAIASDFRPARYLLVLPVVGSGIAFYHLLVERGVVAQSAACLLSAPGGCATRWIDEFGFVTIPTLALTTSLLLLGLLALAAAGDDEPVVAAEV
jgi:disulfide bond formation protein DsbB